MKGWQGNKVILGLDLETSASDLHRGAVPIQLGMAFIDKAGREITFTEDIGGWEFSERPQYDASDCAWWDDEAFGIHRITRERLEVASDNFVVSRNAERWLDEHDLNDPPNIHIVGWNVAGFDLPFVRKFMPKLASRLSYRTIDLNAVCFALTGQNVPPSKHPGGTLGYQQVKRHAKDYAAQSIGTSENWHDAGYDALAAVYSFEALRDMIRRVS